jgi:hypothetical protein
MAERGATGKDIILDIVENMRSNCEELLYSTIVPAVYEVYLHPDDYERLQGILPAIQEQARRALDEEIAKRGAGPGSTTLLKRLMQGGGPPPEAPKGGWQISFHRDADEELEKGEIMVVSSLALPQRPDFGAGQMTRRLATSHKGEETRQRSRTVETAAPPAADQDGAFAVLTYSDNAGPHTFPIAQASLVIGRGGIGYWVDVKVATASDVSREHCRIRRDPDTGQFFIKDLSTFGTTVNGTRVPSSMEGSGAQRHDRNIETLLPPVARIGLADVVFLDFKASPQASPAAGEESAART